jgi:tryptophan synthase alpha chain
MNRIIKAFRSRQKRGGKVFIPYITAGDPNLARTMEILEFFAGNGADIIELGVPFSDPMADGPVIQRGMERALAAGTTLPKILNLIRSFRERHDLPIILMGYCNPFYAYGFEKFARDAKDAGVDGILTVDLPPEEAGEFTGLLRRQGLLSIFLATPVTDSARLRIIGRAVRGFVYFVSVTGVTGERQALSGDIRERIVEVMRSILLPVVLGFGLSGPEVIKQFHSSVDGFVVGSALVKRLGETMGSPDKEREFRDFFIAMARQCHRST